MKYLGLKKLFLILFGVFTCCVGSGNVYSVPVHVASDEETRFHTVDASTQDDDSAKDESVVSQGLLDFLNTAPTYEIPPSEES